MEMEVVHVVDTCSLSSRAGQTLLDFSLHSITFLCPQVYIGDRSLMTIEGILGGDFSIDQRRM